MSDFLDELAGDNVPVARELTFNGKTGEVFVKCITAGQKLALVRGKKYAYDTAKGAVQTIDVDLEENERAQQAVVSYCICNPDGSPKYKNIEAVSKLDSRLVAALYAIANEYNKAAGDTDAGEA